MSNVDWGIDGGVYFGYGASSTEGKPPPINTGKPIRYVGDRHIVTIGPNGSGKSRRLLMVNLAELSGWSMLVIDPKGELADWTLEHRKKHGSKIIRLNPFDALQLGSDAFNPIAALDPKSDDFPDDALGLAEAIIRVEGHEPHWSQSAQDLICALIMYVRLALPKDGNLGDVRNLLGLKAAEFRQIVVGDWADLRPEKNEKPCPGMILLGKGTKCEELVAKAGRFADIAPENRELASILSVALTQTRWLDSRPMKANLSHGAFDFSRMKEESTTVYLILPARRLGTHSTWLRLMITAVLQPLIRDTRRSKVPVLFMLDECAQLGHLPVIEQNLALMRGYGIKLWTVFQDLSQPQAIYDKRWESFFGNAGVVQSFAPQDVTTAEYLSKRTGQATRTALATGDVNDVNAKLSLSQVAVPLMLPQDLRNMEAGYSVIFTHKLKGTVRSYFPDPYDLTHIRTALNLPPPD